MLRTFPRRGHLITSDMISEGGIFAIKSINYVLKRQNPPLLLIGHGGASMQDGNKAVINFLKLLL